MVKNNLPKRHAFTLIELIFAIVLISIAVISLPTMTQTSSKGIEISFAQEAIFAASQELNLALSFRWDESASDDVNSAANVLNLANDCDASTLIRPGHIAQPKHRRCVDNLTLGANNGLVDNIVNFDLNDVTHGPLAVFTSTNADSYKQNYNSTVTVTDLAPLGANWVGIKQLTVSITTPDNTPVTSLSALTCNIGEVEDHHWLYP